MKRLASLLLLATLGLAAMFLLDRTYRQSLQQDNNYHLEYAAAEARDFVTDASRAQIAAVEHLRAFMLATPDLPAPHVRDVYAERLLQTTPMLEAVHFVDRNFITDHRYPPGFSGPPELRTPYLLPSLRHAVDRGTVTVSEPMATRNGNVFIVINAALYRQTRFLGLVQGVFNLQPLLQEVTEHTGPQRALRLADSNDTVFWGSETLDGPTVQETASLADKAWTVTVGWRDGPPGPEPFVLALIWGLGGALVLNMLFLVNRTWTRTDWLESAVAEKTTKLGISERRYRSLVEQAGDGIFILDTVGRIQEINSSGLQMLAYDEDELVGQSAEVLLPDEMAQPPFHSDQIEEGQALAVRSQLRRKDGTTLPVEISAKLLADGRLMAIVRDITERVEAEEALRQSAARAEALVRTAARLNQPQVDYRAVLDTICQEAARVLQVPSVAISLLDEEKEAFQFAASVGLPSQFEDEAKPVMLSTLKEFKGDRQMPLVLSDVQALSPSPLALLFRRFNFRTVAFVDLTYRSRLLGILSVHVFGETRAFSGEERDLLRGFADQASQAIANANLFRATRRLLQRTRQQGRQMQRIIDTVPEGVILLNANDRILLMNPAARQYLAAMSGAEVGDVLDSLDGRPLQELLADSGEEMPWQELQPSDSDQAFMLTERPVESEAGHAGRVLVIRDVTEERRRQQHLQNQERLATVGQLAAGIAHDFNNIMAIITLYSQTLERNPEFPRRREYLATISKQAGHAANLIAQILDFSRRSVMERGRLDLLPFVKEVAKLLQRTLPENIVIELDTAPGDYRVHADPTRLQQALMNLAVNARDVMPQGGELRIGLTEIHLEPGQRAPLPDMAAGDWKCLTVSDTGTGVESGELQHLFEPFFTTKERGQGTGLGLAQVYGIVKQHGGEIEVESQPGQGTRFTIYLPGLEPGQAGGRRILHHKELPRAEQETILLVEDHEPTRVAIQDTLEMMGYEVLLARTGREALDLFAEHGSVIDLVLSDMVMPEMGGMDLYHCLVEQRAQVKMMVMTGYPLEDEGRSLLEQGIVDWIRKPFSPDELGTKLRQMLEREMSLLSGSEHS